MIRKPAILFLLACFIIITVVSHFIRCFNSTAHFNPVEPAPPECTRIRLYEKDLEKLIARQIIGQSIPALGGWAVKIESCTASCYSSRIELIAQVAAYMAGRAYTDQLTVLLSPYAEQGCLTIRLQDVYWNRLRLTCLPGLDHYWENMVLPAPVTYQNNSWKIDLWPNCTLLQATLEDHYLVLTVSAK